ncbi:hypothetical protein J6590_009525 [Homalodisca vitripennis]|nr:hypothetical protein J6590_009525 [Homalodisca vitripennis]
MDDEGNWDCFLQFVRGILLENKPDLDREDSRQQVVVEVEEVDEDVEEVGSVVGEVPEVAEGATRTAEETIITKTTEVVVVAITTVTIMERNATTSTRMVTKLVVMASEATETTGKADPGVVDPVAVVVAAARIGDPDQTVEVPEAVEAGEAAATLVAEIEETANNTTCLTKLSVMLSGTDSASIKGRRKTDVLLLLGRLFSQG